MGWARALVAFALVGCGAAGGAPTPESATPGLSGAAILERTCTECHGLGGLQAYAEYWGEAEWRSMVETMMGYGATLTPGEFEILVGYLATTY